MITLEDIQKYAGKFVVIGAFSGRLDAYRKSPFGDYYDIVLSTSSVKDVINDVDAAAMGWIPVVTEPYHGHMASGASGSKIVEMASNNAALEAANWRRNNKEPIAKIPIHATSPSIAEEFKAKSLASYFASSGSLNIIDQIQEIRLAAGKHVRISHNGVSYVGRVDGYTINALKQKVYVELADPAVGGPLNDLRNLSKFTPVVKTARLGYQMLWQDVEFVSDLEAAAWERIWEKASIAKPMLLSNSASLPIFCGDAVSEQMTYALSLAGKFISGFDNGGVRYTGRVDSVVEIGGIVCVALGSSTGGAMGVPAHGVALVQNPRYSYLLPVRQCAPLSLDDVTKQTRLWRDNGRDPVAFVISPPPANIATDVPAATIKNKGTKQMNAKEYAKAYAGREVLHADGEFEPNGVSGLHDTGVVVGYNEEINKVLIGRIHGTKRERRRDANGNKYVVDGYEAAAYSVSVLALNPNNTKTVTTTRSVEGFAEKWLGKQVRIAANVKDDAIAGSWKVIGYNDVTQNILVDHKFGNPIASAALGDVFLDSSAEHYGVIKLSEAVPVIEAAATEIPVAAEVKPKAKPVFTHKDAENIINANVREVPLSNAVLTEEEDEKGLISRAFEVAKVDAANAGWRISAKQFLETVKTPLMAALKRHGNKKGKAASTKMLAFKELLESSLGEGLLAIVVSMALQTLPLNGVQGDVVKRIASELRVEAMTTAGNELAGIIMEPVREMLSTMIVGDSINVLGAVAKTHVAQQPAQVKVGGKSL